jgi:hypothetical protein
MNVSKRTWVVLGIAIIAILAAFASLYFEKESEIKTLENIEPYLTPDDVSPIKLVRNKKQPVEVKSEPLPNITDDGNKTE